MSPFVKVTPPAVGRRNEQSRDKTEIVNVRRDFGGYFGRFAGVLFHIEKVSSDETCRVFQPGLGYY